mgnify:CR=1 FL=1
MSEQTEESIAEPGPAYRLYTTTQVATACFFASFLASGLLIGFNYQKLGDKVSAWRSFVIGLVSTVVLLFIAFKLPENSPSYGIGLLSILIAKKWAEVEQGRALKIHKDKGGLPGSNWKVAGVVLMTLTVLFVSVVGYVVATEPELQSLQFGKSNVYYMAPVQEVEARKMGESLQKAELGLFSAKSAMVLLRKSDVEKETAGISDEVDRKRSRVQRLDAEFADLHVSLEQFDTELMKLRRRRDDRRILCPSRRSAAAAQLGRARALFMRREAIHGSGNRLQLGRSEQSRSNWSSGRDQFTSHEGQRFRYSHGSLCGTLWFGTVGS